MPILFLLSSLLPLMSGTVMERFTPPEGFERVVYEKGSFRHYLQCLPLKPESAKVHYFNGAIKDRPDVYAAVVDLDIGDRDLQQCADAVMRLRAEFLYAQGRANEISFNFTNGFSAPYSKWRSGSRIAVKGNEVYWYGTRQPYLGYKTFRKYLDMVFAYASTISLEQELQKRSLADLSVGDVFIQAGSPGHAVIVVDLAVHPETGQKAFMLAQSYMPAQDIQILKNPAGGVWYFADDSEKLFTPEWTFKFTDLKTW